MCSSFVIRSVVTCYRVHVFTKTRSSTKKDAEGNTLRLKCILLPHGNRDREKHEVPSDCATVQFPVIRMILSLCALYPSHLASIDITGTYLQGKPLDRNIFMRPPKGWCRKGVVWKLIRPAYGLVDSGKIWQLTIENCLLKNGYEQVAGIPQFFISRDGNNFPTMFMVKVVDDFLIASTKSHLIQFHECLAGKFNIGKFDTGNTLRFNGTFITQSSERIQLDMSEYFSTVNSIEVQRARRKRREEGCTPAEITEYLPPAGKLNFLGHGSLPQAVFVASHLQQAIPHMTVQNLITANQCLHELKSLTPPVTYKRRPAQLPPIYLAFSDASIGGYIYGQTGYISGISVEYGRYHIFHSIDWHSSKQTRVSFSPVGAEIIAASDSADRASLICDCITRVCHPSSPLPFVLTVDSMGSYDTITTSHEGREYRLRPTVPRLRHCYEGGEIHSMQWIPEKCNIADALTKRNKSSYQLLNNVMENGCLEGYLSSIRIEYPPTDRKTATNK